MFDFNLTSLHDNINSFRRHFFLVKCNLYIKQFVIQTKPETAFKCLIYLRILTPYHVITPPPNIPQNIRPMASVINWCTNHQRPFRNNQELKNKSNLCVDLFFFYNICLSAGNPFTVCMCVYLCVVVHSPHYVYPAHCYSYLSWY